MGSGGIGGALGQAAKHRPPGGVESPVERHCGKAESASSQARHPALCLAPAPAFGDRAPAPEVSVLWADSR